MARRIEFIVDVDSTGAVRSLRQVDDTAEQAGDSVQQFGKRGASAGKSLKQAMRGAQVALAAVTAAAAAAAVAIVGTVKAVASFAADTNEIAKSARAIGTSAEQLQLLQGAFDLMTSGGADAARAIQDLQRNLADARDGTGEAKDSLDKLGLSASDLLDLPLPEQFATIADRMGKLEDVAERTQVAMDVFGRSGRKLGPAFSEGGDAVRQAVDEIARAGIVSNQAAADSEVLTDSIDLLKRSMSSLKADTLAPMIPALTALSDGLALVLQDLRDTDAAEEFGEALSTALVEVGAPAIGIFGGAVVVAMEASEKAFNRATAAVRLWSAVVDLGTGDLPGFAENLAHVNKLGAEYGDITEESDQRLRAWVQTWGRMTAEMRLTLETFESLGEESTRAAAAMVDGAGEAAEAVDYQAAIVTQAQWVMAESARRAREAETAAHLESLEAQKEASKEAREAEREAAQRDIDERAERRDTILGYAQDVAGQTLAILAEVEEVERASLDRRVDAQRAAADRVLSLESALAVATNKITRERLQGELDAAREREEAAREETLRSFKRTKALAVVQAIIGTASAVISGLSSQPFLPVGIIMGALAGTLGAIQIATIAAQPPPQLHSGSNSLLRDETMIRARRGEAILSPTGVAAAGGEEAIRGLNKGRGGAATTIVVEQRVRTRVLDSQAYDLGRSRRGALQQQIQRGKARPGSHRPAGLR